MMFIRRYAMPRITTPATTRDDWPRGSRLLIGIHGDRHVFARVLVSEPRRMIYRHELRWSWIERALRRWENWQWSRAERRPPNHLARGA